jgi:2-hydroxycyclohexanecarboxyl-CoA dehydrogenase
VHTREGRVAVVTGGTSGIGRGIAGALAQRGAAVVLGGRSEDSARRTLADLRAQGAPCEFASGDVRSRADMDRLLECAHERFGGVDIVVPALAGMTARRGRPRFAGPSPTSTCRVCVRSSARRFQRSC